MDSTLALFGGKPALPQAAPDWPIQDAAIQQRLLETWASGAWGRYEGPAQQELAELLARYQGSEHVYLCSSGTLAVELALRGVGVTEQAEVILGGYDFPGNFRAIECIGARPVLVDLAADRWHLDPEQLDQAVTDRTRAVVVSHLHGHLCDMPRVRQWAEQRSLAVVEDACQVPGAVIAGKRAGSWGTAGVLSFGGSKLLTSGRGGAVLADDPQVVQRIRVYAERGNLAYPLSELQATVLIAQVQQLDRRNQQRLQAVKQLQQEVATQLEAWSVHVAWPETRPQCVSAYYKLGFRCPVARVERAQLVAALQAEGAPMDVGFRGFAGRGGRRCERIGELPVARAAAAETVLLHHPILLEDELRISQLATAIRKVMAHYYGGSP